MAWIVVVFGPSLPGRDLLEQALQRALPADARIIADELRTVRERRALARGLAACDARAVWVGWTCDPPQAEREIFHHYAGMPERYADARWHAYQDDAVEREPPGDEATPLIAARAGEALDAIVTEVAARIGPGAPATAPPRRVLVVEDDEDQRTLLCDALTHLGCDVAAASSAEEALAIAQSQRLDLVVADHTLPGASGADLAKALAAVQPDVHVAIVTGHPDQAMDALGRRPVDVVLAKPIGITDLIHLVDDMARRAPSA